jgi:hypothetical protein
VIHVFFSLLLVFTAIGLSSCSPRLPGSTTENAADNGVAKHSASPQHETPAASRAKNKSKKHARRSWNELGDDWLPPLPTPGATVAVGVSDSPWTRGAPFTESQAVERIARELKDALQLRPTLVVWILDQSAAAGTMRRAVASAAVQMPSRIAGQEAGSPTPIVAGDAANKLSTAIIAFGTSVHVLTPRPIADAEKLPDPSAIEEVSTPPTQAYAAVNKAAELFAPYRLHGHEVVFVLVADRAVADEANFISATKGLSKVAIRVFGIGPAAPFGRLTDSLSADLKPVSTTIDRDSLYSERIKLYFTGNEGDAELTDSGYGPFHLERLCRATKGCFLRLLPNGSPGWATEDDGDVFPPLLRRYAPDYVSEDEYQKILSENRACQALHEAAQLPPARVLVPPTYDFRKQEEAAMNRALSVAQRASAENQTALERLHQTLAAGEPDRPRLTRPRWQAAFDLAYGRACAARARNDGYNHMLALLKFGKPFANAQSTTWSLKPAEGIPGSSDLDTLARKAKTLLERVVREHPGTPWAAMAARELQTPCGWEWTER